jgi:anti-sigma factor RsiW
MMTCRELTELLIDFVSGELAPEHMEQIREHLAWCPPCVTFVETYQLTIRLTRQLPPVPVPPGLECRLRAALAEMKKEQT